MTIARDWKYICCLWLSEGAIVFPLMQLNVNTYANSVIKSSFTLIKFMEVLMNVYLRYSFNCWRKWLYILRKWTAKGVIIITSKYLQYFKGIKTSKTLWKHPFHSVFTEVSEIKVGTHSVDAGTALLSHSTLKRFVIYYTRKQLR